MSYDESMELIVTGDGSHSLYVKALEESYHSRTGAYFEARHVFIRGGLFALFKHLAVGMSQTTRLQTHPSATEENNEKRAGKGQGPSTRGGDFAPEILEIGWGTGLNAILSFEQAVLYERGIRYTALEPHPLPQFLVRELNYWKFLDARVKDYFLKLHEVSWEEEHDLGVVLGASLAGSRFTKHKTTLENFTSTRRYDLVYFDAFGLSKQPEVWSLANFQKLGKFMKRGGILVSYAANRVFHDHLLASGFEVTKLPGAQGKREMIRARKL